VDAVRQFAWASCNHLASFAESDLGAGGFSPQMIFSQGVLWDPLGQYISTLIECNIAFYHARLSNLWPVECIAASLERFVLSWTKRSSGRSREQSLRFGPTSHRMTLTFQRLLITA
jgi:hypothetical protein